MTRTSPPGEGRGIESEIGSREMVDLGSVLMAYLNVEKAERDAGHPGLGEIEIFNPEGKPVGYLLPPTSERAHASIRLREGKRIIPLAQADVRVSAYDPKGYRIGAKDATRIQELNRHMLDKRERSRSDAAMRERARPERERDPIREVQELLERRFIGMKDVVKAFTIEKGASDVPLLSFKPEVVRATADRLRQKLQTDEAKALLEVLRKDPQEAANWALILRVARLDQGADLTLASTRLALTEDMRKRHQGPLLDIYGDFSHDDFYARQKLRDGFLRPESDSDWMFVHIKTIPGTNGVPPTEQDKAIGAYLKRKNLTPLVGTLLRRSPVEAVYDYAMFIRTSADPKQDPIFRTPVCEAIDFGDDELYLVVGPYNPHSGRGLEMEKQDPGELEGEVGAVISF